MKTITARFVRLALIAALLGSGSARAEEGAERAPSDSCGRVASLEAAKHALARGDRAQALEHLRNADALLDACARSSDRNATEQEAESGEPAMAHRVAGKSSSDLS